jgi:hypothetical protein
MRRIALVLTVLGILCVAVGQAQAHGPYYYGGHHRAYYAPVVVSAPVWATPRVVVAAPVVVYRRPVCYPSAYSYPSPYYAPVPRAGFYYQSRGLSLGIGW